MTIALVTHYPSREGQRERIGWRCAGCGEVHLIPIDADGWSWNRSTSSPTIAPSILGRWTNAGVPVVCHSFVRDGVVDFLTDCTHELAGRRVPMNPELADPFGEEAIDDGAPAP